MKIFAKFQKRFINTTEYRN